MEGPEEDGRRWEEVRERGGIGGGRREFQEAGQVLLLRGQDQRNREEWVWKRILVV